MTEVWKRDFKKPFFNAILLSVVPVSATMAGVVPICVGVLTVPHCDLCSSLTEKPCTDGYKRRYFYLIKCCTAVAVKSRFQSLFYLCQNFAFSYAIYIALCYLLHASSSSSVRSWTVKGNFKRNKGCPKWTLKSKQRIWFYSQIVM